MILAVITLAFTLTWGCGGNKLYVPPDSPEAGRLVIVNDIFGPGFYVEIDEKDAGFLQSQREITVKPGKHSVKIFNKETKVSENSLTTTHTFEFDVKVAKQDSSLITLSWDDPHYRKKVDNVAKSIRNTEEEKENRRKTAPERSPF